MLGKRHNAALSKTQMECMECGKIVLSENQHLHIRKSHKNKSVKFKIVNDAKQQKLMFPVAKVDNPDNPTLHQFSTQTDSGDIENRASTSVDDSDRFHYQKDRESATRYVTGSRIKTALPQAIITSPGPVNWVVVYQVLTFPTAIGPKSVLLCKIIPNSNLNLKNLFQGA